MVWPGASRAAVSSTSSSVDAAPLKPSFDLSTVRRLQVGLYGTPSPPNARVSEPSYDRLRPAGATGQGRPPGMPTT